MVRNNNANVVTFQEVGKDQYTILRNQLPGHRFWPRGKFGGSERQIQIAWRRDTFKPVEQGSFWVPGLRLIVPWVRLKDRSTGRRFWVMAVHNAPATGSESATAPPRSRSTRPPPGGPDWMLGNKRGVGYGRLKLIPAFESMHDFMRINARVRPSSKPYWRR